MRHFGEDLPYGVLFPLRFEPRKKSIEVLSELALPIFCVSLFDLQLKFRILHVEVILVCVYIEECSYGDTVLLEDEVLFVVVDTPDECSEVDAGLGEREAIDNSFCPHTQRGNDKIDDG